MNHYSKTITIPPAAIDANGHVNNVVYVQWMQDIALEHYASSGAAAVQGENTTWVVREHKIEYLQPAFAGQELEIRTWVEDARRVRSLRKYEFARKADGALLARGQTDWVFVDARNGRPLPIPPAVIDLLMPR